MAKSRFLISADSNGSYALNSYMVEMHKLCTPKLLQVDHLSSGNFYF
ncbi:unnamed protein product [Cylicocyclus nassatus]|uniref:Uncharacterized protein n=1 Tax=Cylicocyclus nassatus TaxID=53992 RepID=A0AA36DQP2_CYLNA|nr:unnamed protein product [Cylicocyclus nassatus]